MAIADSLTKQALYDSSNKLLSIAFEEFITKKEYGFAVDALTKKANNFFILTNFDSVSFYCTKAISLSEMYLDSVNLPISKTYILLGQLNRNLGKLDEALHYLKKSKKMMQQLLDENDYLFALLYRAMGTVYIYKDENKLALDYFFRALSFNDEEHYFTSLTGSLYNGIATVYYFGQNYNKAVEYWDTSMVIRKKVFGAEHPAVANSLSNIAAAFQQLGLIDSAIVMNNKALKIHQKTFGNKHRSIARIYNNLGVLYISIGDFTNAVEYLLKSIQVKKELKTELDIDLQDNYVNLGEAYFGLRNYKEAIKNYLISYKYSLKLSGEISFNVVNVKQNLSKAHLVKGEISKALQYAKEAMENVKKIPDVNDVYIGDAYLVYSSALLSNKDTKQAITYATLAAEILKKISRVNNFNLAECYRIIAKSFMVEKKYDKAIEFCNKTLTIFIENPSINSEKDIEYLIKSGASYGILEAIAVRRDANFEKYKANGNIEFLEKSIADVKISVALAEKTMHDMVVEDSKLNIGTMLKEIINEGILIAYEYYIKKQDLNSFEFALNLSEQSRSIILLESITKSNIKELVEIPDSLLDKEKSLKTSIRYFSRLIAEYELEDESELEYLSQIRTELFDKRRELEELMKFFKQNFPAYSNLLFQNPSILVDDIRNNILDSNQTVVEYLVTKNSIYSFVVSHNSFNLVKRENPENLETNIQLLLNSIKDNNFELFVEKSYSVYQTVFKPIQKFISNERVLIINDGILGYIPFDALLYKEATEVNNYKELPYLIGKYSFGYAFSLNVMRSSKDEINKINNFVGIAPQISK